MPSQLRRRRAPIDVEQDEDEYYEDPPWDDEDEDERPRNRRNTQRRDRDERPSSGRRARSSRDEDDNDRRERRPARRVDRDQPKPKVSRGSGWDTYKDQRSKKAGPANRLQVKDKEVIVHFLEPEPFAIYEQHWIGQRSYTCPDEKKCPLCGEGLPSRTIALFNVVNMETAENLYWEAGPKIATRIKAAAEKKSTSPISREDLYFAVNRSKQSNGFFDYELDAIKERDLYDDYKLEPLSDDELDEALGKLFDESVIPYTDSRTLKIVAEGGDDDD